MVAELTIVLAIAFRRWAIIFFYSGIGMYIHPAQCLHLTCIQVEWCGWHMRLTHEYMHEFTSSCLHYFIYAYSTQSVESLTWLQVLVTTVVVINLTSFIPWEQPRLDYSSAALYFWRNKLMPRKVYQWKITRLPTKMCTTIVCEGVHIQTRSLILKHRSYYSNKLNNQMFSKRMCRQISWKSFSLQTSGVFLRTVSNTTASKLRLESKKS